MGLGSMERECGACAGVGYISIPEEPIISVKRTRKPRGVIKQEPKARED